MEPTYQHNGITLYQGDCLAMLADLPSNSVHLVVTSPPYNKRGFEGKKRVSHSSDAWAVRNIAYQDFGDDLPEMEYQAQQVAVLTELHRILVPGGSLFYNHKHRVKDFTVSLPTDWIVRSPFKLRQEIVWNRQTGPNIDPIRFHATTERVYWLFKGAKPRYFNPACMNYGEVWNITVNLNTDHPAPFPEELARRCIEAGSRPGEIVLDPYTGSGTTLRVAKDLGRVAIGIERSPQYCQDTIRRLAQEVLFAQGAA